MDVTHKKTRPQLTAKEQIEHLKTKGIKFDLISEEAAEHYLTYNNYYFKLRSYRKNFPKYQSGSKIDTYINLDFAMLKDLAIIDMKLRQVLLLMSLDIEHFEKVTLLKKVSESFDNGYEIVKEYMDYLKGLENNGISNAYSLLMADINRNSGNEYCGGIIEKYNNEYPIWAFVEVIPFGSFISFLNFCGRYLDDKKLKDDFYLLKGVKRLRNAAAHNSCIIHNLSPKTAKFDSNYNVLRFIRQSKFGITKSSMDSQMSNAAICDITTLIYTHTVVVTSEGVKVKQSKALKDVMERCYEHIDYYKTNELITASFSFLKKVVDNAYEM